MWAVPVVRKHALRTPSQSSRCHLGRSGSPRTVGYRHTTLTAAAAGGPRCCSAAMRHWTTRRHLTADAGRHRNNCSSGDACLGRDAYHLGPPRLVQGIGRVINEAYNAVNPE